MSQTNTLQALFAARHNRASSTDERPYDLGLVCIIIALLSLGIVIVSSASMPEGTAKFDNPYHFIIRHIIFACVAFVIGMLTLTIPMSVWQKYNPYLLFAAFLLLIAVLLVGRSVNGATRWIALGPINIQAAEPAKLFFFAYLAGYLVRRYEEVTEHLKGYAKPMVVFFVLGVLLLNQPDFGTTVVMFITTLGLLFLVGAKILPFVATIATGAALIVVLIIFAEYRMRRITAFLDPWADPFGSGYQLTQSLMAYGRGDWFGQGLGNSLQKLQFLPEAHTDFIVAILAEELGFVGVLVLLGLIMALVFKALFLGKRALQHGMAFSGYFAYAIGIWFSFQTVVNIGASAGALPTKGLTLPLVSYGGSSLITMAIAVAVLLRIDYECRMAAKAQAKKVSIKTTDEQIEVYETSVIDLEEADIVEVARA
ncbi:MAG: cell division protein FtsW [Glaciecola sp.]